MTNFVSEHLAATQFETQALFWTGFKQVPGPVDPCHHVVPQPAGWIRAANRVAPDTNQALANENPQKPLLQLLVAARDSTGTSCIRLIDRKWKLARGSGAACVIVACESCRLV
jgi:hypothetical protein